MERAERRLVCHFLPAFMASGGRHTPLLSVLQESVIVVVIHAPKRDTSAEYCPASFGLSAESISCFDGSLWPPSAMKGTAPLLRKILFSRVLW
jgi:hypothetical protein